MKHIDYIFEVMTEWGKGLLAGDEKPQPAVPPEEEFYVSVPYDKWVQEQPQEEPFDLMNQ